MNSIEIGRVTEIVDKSRFVIKATVKGSIENVIAYPLDTPDEPEIDEEVVLFGLETIFGLSYLYKKSRLFNHTRFKFQNSLIDLTEDGIVISTKEGNDIYVSSDGDLKLSSKGSLTIKATGDVRLESEESITLDAPTIEFPTGTVTPNPMGGPFNCLPTCPLGGPHQGNVLIKK